MHYLQGVMNMEINSPSQAYSQYTLSNASKSSMKQGETLQATPYEGTAFDNVKESVRYHKRNTSNDFDKIVNTGAEKLSMLDAKNDNHTLVNGVETAKNINLYAASMFEQGREHVTQATVSIGGTFVALQTTDGSVSTPFKAAENYESAEEYNKVNRANELFQQANGDFSVFVGKLQAEFGTQVSVETFAENEGPDYSEAHLMLNGTTFDSFVTEQTDKMNEVRAIREKTLMQFEHQGEGEMPFGLKVNDKSTVQFINSYNEVSSMT